MVVKRILAAIGAWTVALMTGEAAPAVPGASQAVTVTPLRMRRSFIRGKIMRRSRALTPAVAVAAVVAMSASMPSSAVTASPIRHIVVLYLENHSFDNVLGFWCDQHAQVAASRCPDGGMPASVRLSNGAVVVPSTDPDTVPNENHNVAAQVAAMNIKGGVPHMNGWQNVTGCGAAMSPPYLCVSGYKPSQIPNITSLATRFAISDRTFSMGDSSSWGGHLYAGVASLDGFLGNNPRIPGVGGGHGWGCPHDTVTQWVSPSGKMSRVPGCIPDPSPKGVPNGGAFEPTPVSWVPSIFDRLDKAGLPWSIYDGVNGASFGGWSICPSLADCWYTAQKARVKGTQEFAAAAAAGRLPAFSIIAPSGKNTRYSQHNSLSMTAGDNFIGQIAHEVMTGPEWSSTVLIITYDDCGCFYDQVPPGINPDGTRRGPRTPLVIVSPWARPGYTDTTPTTFAGILAFAEHTFGLAPLSANDAAAYDFSAAFNFSQAPLKPAHMVRRPLPASARHIRINQALLDDPT
jgi:phospholipase C